MARFVPRSLRRQIPGPADPVEPEDVASAGEVTDSAADADQREPSQRDSSHRESSRSDSPASASRSTSGAGGGQPRSGQRGSRDDALTTLRRKVESGFSSEAEGSSEAEHPDRDRKARDASQAGGAATADSDAGTDHEAADDATDTGAADDSARTDSSEAETGEDDAAADPTETETDDEDTPKAAGEQAKSARPRRRVARASRDGVATGPGRRKRSAELAATGSRTIRAGRKVVAAPRAGSNRREKMALATLSRLRRLALNLTVWVVIAGLLAATAGYLWYRGHQIEEASRDAVAAASAAAEAIFSYDYRNFEDSVANGKDFVTGDFAKEYAKTTADIKETVIKEKAVVRAKVSAASVTYASPDRVEVLLFVNQYRRNVNITGQKVDQNRVLLTMEYVDDAKGGSAWLVAEAVAI